MLVDHFLKKYSQRLGKTCRISSECLELLEHYPFPGNVRELENEVVRALTLATEGEELRPRLFSDNVREKGRDYPPVKEGSIQDQTSHLEQAMIEEALKACQGNRSKTALKLGLSRRGLLNKIKRYGLD